MAKKLSAAQLRVLRFLARFQRHTYLSEGHDERVARSLVSKGLVDERPVKYGRVKTGRGPWRGDMRPGFMLTAEGREEHARQDVKTTIRAY